MELFVDLLRLDFDVFFSVEGPFTSELFCDDSPLAASHSARAPWEARVRVTVRVRVKVRVRVRAGAGAGAGLEEVFVFDSKSQNRE